MKQNGKEESKLTTNKEDKRIIYRKERIKEEFQFHLQISSSHHKLHVLNNYICLTIIQSI